MFYLKLSYKSDFFKYSIPFNIVSILFCWITGIIIGSLPLLGWRDDTLDDIEEKCTFSKIKSTSYFLFRNITSTITPMMSIFLIYGLIYVKVKKVSHDPLPVPNKIYCI